MGERKPNEAETVSLAGRIAPDDEHDRCCCRPRHLQSRSDKLAHDSRFPAFQIGKRIVVSREKFLDWLNRQGEEQKCA